MATGYTTVMCNMAMGQEFCQLKGKKMCAEFSYEV